VALFRYQALSNTGESLSGQMEAGSEAEVIARLQEQGHLPVKAERADASNNESSLSTLFRKQALTGKQVLQFTQQLATLLGAGQPLDRALNVLLEMPETPEAKRVIERIRDSVRSGTSLSTAMEQQHGVFSRLYVNLVRAGELGGNLQPALQRLADYLERMQDLRSQVIGALIYPAILLLMVGASLVILLGFVVPEFHKLLTGMNAELGWLQRVVFAVSLFIRDYWYWLAIIAVVAVGYMISRYLDPQTRPGIDAWLLSRPRLGALLGKLDTARFVRTLGTLLNNGVPLLTAMSIARQVLGNTQLAACAENAQNDVKNGQGLAYSLSKGKVFPRLALQMIQVGEESGALPSMLLKTADTFDTETQRAIQGLLAALVPVVTLLMALLVGVIIFAVLVPLFQLGNALG
jgi:general secretion pathway protein F